MRPLDRPIPLMHLYGINPCQAICCLTTVEAAGTDGIAQLLPMLTRLDGQPWTKPVPPRIPGTSRVGVWESLLGPCEACGGGIPISNLGQLFRPEREPRVDLFQARVKTAILRHRRSLSTFIAVAVGSVVTIDRV